MAYTTINKPNLYFNTVTYTGDGASNRAITGYNFSPDLVWHKSRSNSYNHYLFDKVRGVAKTLFSNSTSAEDTSSFTTSFNSFDSDGFTVTQVGGIEMNQNAVTYANWGWKANGAGVSNTAGTISSTVSANTTAGFSIVSYTGNGTAGATVGHGLGSIPKMVIIKCRTSTPSWQVWGDGYTRLSLNNTDGDLGNNGMTRGTSTFSLPSGINDWNGSGLTYIAYCWSEVKGFSKFGSYTGNGSTDGTFVYTGFKPAFVLTKVINSAEQWYMWDNKRDTFNPQLKYLLPNGSFTETASYSSGILDFVSNGFKFRNGTGTYWNGSGSNYIYMAFAEQPLVGTNNVPATAR